MKTNTLIKPGRVGFEPGARASVQDILQPVRGRAVQAQTYPNPVAHPLGPPSLSGTTITVDTMLQQPTRITRMIMDLSAQRFIADRVFASGGGVTGGAVIYDEVQANELYTNRDVERIAPGGEFPIVTGERRVPKLAEVEKWGGKVYVEDEARDRNDVAAFTNLMRQLANTVVRKINARAIQTLETAITASGRTIVGRNWSTITFTGPDAGQTTAQNAAIRDFALASKQAETEEFGLNYNLWLLNPQEYANLVIAYGSGLNALLAAMGVSIYVSNRVAAGTAYAVAEKQAGQMRIEKPLGSESWREAKTERTWVQSGVRPLMFVDNPFAVLKFTGLAG